MIVESLSLKNFLSYREPLELDFKGKRTIGIAGGNEAGKSTILRAICYGAYGNGLVDREIKMINDRATSPMVVEQTLLLDTGRRLEIERGRTLKNEAILKVAGMAGNVSAVQAQLEEAIRLDFRDFVDLSYFVQGDIHGFMEGNKRSYFQRWTRSLDYWAKLEHVAKTVGFESQGERDRLVRQLDQLTATVERLAQVSRTVDSAKSRQRKAESRQARTESRVSELGRLVAREDAQEEARASLDALEDELDALTEQVEDHRHRINTLRRELTKISKGRCPLIDIDCKPLEAKGSKRRKSIRTEISKLSGTATEITDKQEGLRASIKEAKRARQPSTAARDLKQAEGDLARARGELREAQEFRAKVVARHTAAKGAEKEARDVRAKIAVAERELSRAKFLQYMCGKSGVPSGLIETELAAVEDRCNWILERLHYSKRIRFSPYKTLAGYEKICPRCGSEKWSTNVCTSCGTDRPRKRKDEPTVTVLDGTAERSFDLESGGARVLQSFAVRMAGGLFVSSMTGVPLRMIMLDEVFAMLDPSNRQRLMALVLDKLVSEFGLRQQFVVSHHDDVVNAVDDLLIVKRQRGESVARWA